MVVARALEGSGAAAAPDLTRAESGLRALTDG
jgi:hypothetical protein